MRGERKNEILFRLLGQVDDRMIEETAPDPAKTMQRKTRWKRWVSLAACLAVCLLIGRMIFLQQVTKMNQSEISAPKTIVYEQWMKSMGDGGFLASDASDLINANPWYEGMRPDSLPVYQNRSSLQQANDPVSEEQFARMQSIAGDLERRMNLNGDAMKQSDNRAELEREAADIKQMGEEPAPGFYQETVLRREGKDVTIRVNRNLTADVFFHEPQKLPETLRFREDASEKELTEAAKYLIAQYGKLLAMKEPRIDISGGSYLIEYQKDGSGKERPISTQTYELQVYDAAGDIAEQMANYALASARFFPNPDGTLAQIRMEHRDASFPVGAYPVTKMEQAREKLIHELISSGQEQMNVDHVKKVELVYTNDSYMQYFLPVYRFTVEAPGRDESGLRRYVQVDVPAVKAERIEIAPSELQDTRQ